MLALQEMMSLPSVQILAADNPGNPGHFGKLTDTHFPALNNALQYQLLACIYFSYIKFSLPRINRGEAASLLMNSSTKLG